MRILSIVFFVLIFLCASAAAQTTEFTYQGSLKNSGTPATGNYDFEFKLFDLGSGGTQQGSTIQRLNVAVTDGHFAVSLDFGVETFLAEDLFLVIAVRTAGGGTFTTLSPRQRVSSAPYAVRSYFSSLALTANSVAVSGIPAGSGNYVQNTTSPQASTNFNISGNGTAGGTLSASTVSASQYDIEGLGRILKATSNSVFLGNGAGNLASGQSNTFVGGLAGLTTSGTANAFFAYNAGFSNTTGSDGAFFGLAAGINNSSGSSNSFFGRSAGVSNTIGGSNTIIGAYANVAANNLTNATAIGANAIVSQDNALVLGSGADVGIGTSAPEQVLHVNGNTEIMSTGNGAGFKFRNRGSTSSADDWVWYAIGNKARLFHTGDGDRFTITPSGVVAIGALGTAGGTSLCLNASNEISTCSSSLRYKTNIGQYLLGMSFLNLLHPISFNWKDGGTHDVGFGAEDIEKIDPRFVTYNKEGVVEGVKYDRLSVAFVNAFKEQQSVIEAQQKRNDELQIQVNELRAVVCSIKADAEICKTKEK